MEAKFVTPALFVADQLSVADLSEAKSLGFRSIINSRPDDEEENQPSHATLAAAAAAAGLDYAHIPVMPGRISDDDVVAFQDACDALPGPVLAFCRSGSRAMQLWARSQAGRLSEDAILKAAQGAGYDLSSMRHQLLRAPARAADAVDDANRRMTTHDDA